VKKDLLLFRLVSLREAATCAEYLVGLGKPADRKVIDAEGFDNSLLVAFTEDFGVDHPGRCSMTDRALDDVHGRPQKEAGARVSRPLLQLGLRACYATDFPSAPRIAFASF
jgi:hypothetical protein